MSDPKPHVVARWIANDLPGDNFRPLRTTIAEVLTLYLIGASEERILELAEALESGVFTELGVVDEQLRRDGVEASFVLDGVPEGAYVKPTGIEARAMLSRLIKLSPVAFEHFCANLVAAFGGVARRVGGTGDGCVDFEASAVPMRCDLLALNQCRPMVIGQAKRYKTGNLVSVSEVREFLGAGILRADQLRRLNSETGMFSPVVFAFWTTSDLSGPARTFARDMGLWCLSGIALAQVACSLKLDPSGT